MQDDGRNLTVAREHLKTAYEEITRAEGQAERSMAEASLARTLDQLKLVIRRLEQQRTLADRREAGRLVERAFASADAALHRVYDVRNAGAVSNTALLDQIRLQVNEALEAVEEALRLGDREAV